MFTARTKARPLIPGKWTFGNNDHKKGLLVDPCVVPPARTDAAQAEEVRVRNLDPSARSLGLQNSSTVSKRPATTHSAGITPPRNRQ